MKAILSIMKKELKIYFSSPLIYIISALFSAIIGWAFFNLLINFVDSTQNLPENVVGQVSFIQAVVYRLFGNINFVMLFICPLITMKLISEEKKNSTLEFLLTAPITSFQIILGKYLSSLVVVFFIISTTFIFPIILSSSGMNAFNNIAMGYLGLIFNIMFFHAVGIFASSLTENQIISALITVICILFVWMVSWASQSTSNYLMAEVFKYAGMIDHFDNFVRGLFKTSDIVYYLTWTGFFLGLSVKTIDSRNW